MPLEVQRSTLSTTSLHFRSSSVPFFHLAKLDCLESLTCYYLARAACSCHSQYFQLPLLCLPDSSIHSLPCESSSIAGGLQMFYPHVPMANQHLKPQCLLPSKAAIHSLPQSIPHAHCPVGQPLSSGRFLHERLTYTQHRQW